MVKDLARKVSDVHWQLSGSGKQSIASVKESIIVLGKLVTDMSEVSRQATSLESLNANAKETNQLLNKVIEAVSSAGTPQTPMTPVVPAATAKEAPPVKASGQPMFPGTSVPVPPGVPGMASTGMDPSGMTAPCATLGTGVVPGYGSAPLGSGGRAEPMHPVPPGLKRVRLMDPERA